MSNKKTVVLFEKGNAPRIFINPKSLSELQERGEILVNPRIPKGVPLEKWFIKNGRIAYKNMPEKIISEAFKEESSNKFRVLVIVALLGLFSIRVYENKEGLKNLYSQIIQKIK